jgi:hypothetical protein
MLRLPHGERPYLPHSVLHVSQIGSAESVAHSEVQGRASDWNYSQSTQTRRFNSSDLLGQIEEMGWHLEHAGYVFVEMGEIARAKAMSSGSVTRTQGYVEGIYLFRRRV